MSILTKNLLLGCSLFLFFQNNFAQENVEKFSFLNPTGTYILKGKKSGAEIKGNFAEIRVKLLDDSKIALTTYFNSGYPKYASDSFIDTLDYSSNSCTYFNELDPACKVIFNFMHDEVAIIYVFKDDGHDCFFGKGIIATGKINKTYDDVPVIGSLSKKE
jgi:hypothetical protein